jgi:hypothetical protein
LPHDLRHFRPAFAADVGVPPFDESLLLADLGVDLEISARSAPFFRLLAANGIAIGYLRPPRSSTSGIVMSSDLELIVGRHSGRAGAGEAWDEPAFGT